MEIPAFMDREDYLQNPIMRRFLKSHNIRFVDGRADYIHAIEEYANQSEENEAEVHEWLLTIIKEGSKEFSYRKVYPIPGRDTDPAIISAKLLELFPECPRVDVLSFRSTEDLTLTDYSIEENDDGTARKINLSYSQLCYYGKEGDITGNVTVFPIFIEIYLDKGFVVSRSKAKSTLFKYDPENELLLSGFRIDPLSECEKLIDEIIANFSYESESDTRIIKNTQDKMLYRLYELYSFTPEDIATKVSSQNDIVHNFIDQIFSNLSLDSRNKEKARVDINIFIEKFLSINGNNEQVFKEDRPAYLINIATDDDVDLTRIDTASNKSMPLQCTEAFFDSKKSVVRSEQCKKLRLVFKRSDDTYFPHATPLIVQLGTHKGHGYIKTAQYAEEVDIQNVLQAVFENY